MTLANLSHFQNPQLRPLTWDKIAHHFLRVTIKYFLLLLNGCGKNLNLDFQKYFQQIIKLLKYYKAKTISTKTILLFNCIRVCLSSSLWAFPSRGSWAVACPLCRASHASRTAHGHRRHSAHMAKGMEAWGTGECKRSLRGHGAPWLLYIRHAQNPEQKDTQQIEVFLKTW